MPNYGIFAQISVLQGLRAKEAKRERKATDLAKVGSTECRDNFNIVAKKLKAISKKSVATIETLSRQMLKRIPRRITEDCCGISKSCRDTVQGKRQSTLLRHCQTLSRQL